VKRLAVILLLELLLLTGILVVARHDCKLGETRCAAGAE